MEPWITSIIGSRRMLIIQSTRISKRVSPMETKIICTALTSMACNTACGQWWWGFGEPWRYSERHRDSSAEPWKGVGREYF